MKIKVSIVLVEELNMKEVNLQKKSIVVISHVYTTVPVEDLNEYLLNKKVKYLLYIKHPLFYKSDLPGSAYYLYKNGKLIETKQIKNIRLPSILKYIIDIFLSIYWVLLLKERFDITICLDNLNTVSGLVLRLLHKVDNVVFYTIDYVPVRFSNKVLNSLYHLIDKIAVTFSDRTWVLTQRMIDGREKLHGIKNTNSKQVIVPIGIWFSRIKRKPISKIHKHTLVYAGGLLPHQGVQLLLKALPLIKKQIPTITLKIIGTGEYEKELKKIVEKNKLDDVVTFLGYFPSHADVEEILTSCALGIGLYSKELDIWSYYADPSKMKTYLAAGLPVVTTDVTYFSEIVKKEKCGVVVRYDEKDVSSKIIDLLSNESQYSNMRKNAIKLASSLDWNVVFDKGFNNLMI